MKKLLHILIAVLALSSPAAAQLDANRTVSTRIADLLAQMPAEDAAQLQANAAEVAALGEEGIVQLAGMLQAPGKGDNSLIEYALGGFSFFVTQPGRDSWRQLAEKAYCQALEKVQNEENKAFIIKQLQIVGGGASVPFLRQYLANARLCDPAARALVQVGTPEAGQALAEALEGARGKEQLSLVQALGDSRYSGAEEKIRGLAGSSDDALRKVSLYALANIADPASLKTLEAAAAASGYTFDRGNATALYLRYLQNLAQNGQGRIAEKQAGRLLKRTSGREQVHTRTAALKLLVDVKGDASLPLLVKTMKSDDPEYRIAALKLAGGLNAPAATATWLKALRKAKDPAVRSEIITFLGNMKSEAALPAVTAALGSGDAGVRLAAIKAVRQIGGAKMLGSLLPLMKNGSEQDIQAVRNAILVMEGAGVTEQVAAALPGMPALAKAALIDVLAARASEEHLEAVLAEVNSSDTTLSKSAVGALKHLVGRDDLPVLFRLLEETDDSDKLPGIQEAVIAAVGDIGNPSRGASLVLSRMESAAPARQARYLPVLASVGGADALRAVAAAFDQGSGSDREAALEALTGWTDSTAAGELYRISSETSNPAYLDKALGGYVSLVSKAGYPAAQKLLMLRKAMEVAKTGQQKKDILRQVQETGTFPALIFAGSFLDQSALQQAAAHAVMEIALSHKKYTGETVKELLTKTIEVLEGQDSDYQKEAIRKHLSEMPAEPGFVRLFNGKDLSGWKGLVANPLKRAEMSSAELAKAQQEADKIMREGWSAENGELIFGGHGSNICTVQKYGDFELYVDWKIEPEGDAGIYLRGTPQVQIWDTSRVDVGAQVGSGGLYNNKVHESKPLVLADNAIGDWNTFHIIMKGERVTVYLNGQLVVDSTVLENYWDRSQPIFPTGQIELQAHGTRVAYRDIYVREIPRGEPFRLSREEEEEGFEILFDGTNLDKWTGNKKGHVVEDGNLVFYPQNGNGNLYTVKEYGDFNFRFEFQLTPGANNGLGIRAPLEGDAAYAGMELQIIDNTADIYKNLKVYQYHGSVYGVIPAKRGFQKPVGEWNQQEVIVKGNRVKVILNGETILDGDIAEASKNGTIDHREHPGLLRKTGHIGFLGHGSEVRFRNIRIKEL